MLSKKSILALIFLTGTISGCSIESLPYIYKVEVQQGNLLTQADLKKVELGMSKRHITYLIGSPNIIDPFHQDRWEYIFTIKPSRGDYKENKITMIFDDEDKLKEIKGSGVTEDYLTSK